MRVVLVDDEQMALDLLEILLKKEDGVTVVGKFCDPREAFSKIEKLNVDAIFLDMEMGEVHGLDLAKEIVSDYPHIPIIFVTAYPQFALEAFEVEAIDYLLKPITSDRLHKAVKRLREQVYYYKYLIEEEEILSNEKLSIQTMGTFRLFDTDKNEVRWRTRKVKELFVYLWHYRDKGVHRTRIIEDLWHDSPKQKVTTLLHTTVYQLRRTLRGLGIEQPVQTINERYQLTVEVRSDKEELEQLMNNERIDQDMVGTVMDLYKGDYLEAESYDWAFHEQQDLKRRYLKLLETYVENNEEKVDRIRLFERCLETMIGLEPYNENYVYMLLYYYGETRNKQKMIEHFNHSKQKWSDELGIDLPKKITTLYSEYIVEK